MINKTYCLGSVTNVRVHVFKVLVGVVHVLVGVDLVELTLSVLKFERVLGGVCVVFTEVGTNKRLVVLCSNHVEAVFKNLSNGNKGSNSPSDSHISEVTTAHNCLTGHPVTCKP